MNYTIYNLATGEITRIISAPQDQVIHQYNQLEEGALSGSFEDGKFYIENAVAVPIPARPSTNHTFNYVTKQWEDPRILSDIKAQQWELIKKARTSAEYAGFTWDGSTFDSDQVSQQRITGAVVLAQLNPNYSVNWVLANNTSRTLSAADVIAVGQALGQHVELQFSKSQTLREQINAATTKEEVEAITWE